MLRALSAFEAAKKTVAEATVLKNETKNFGDQLLRLPPWSRCTRTRIWYKILPFYDGLMFVQLEKLQTNSNKLFIYIRKYVSIVTLLAGV